MSTADTALPRRWSPVKRVAFRFAFTYLILYHLPYPAGGLPGTMWLADAHRQLWQWIAAPIGKHVLRIPGEMAMVEPNGSGDTTFNYVQCFCYLLIAALAAIVWSVIADRRTRDAKLHEGLRIYIRYALGSTMLTFGIIKVLLAQFPFPGAERLAQAYGDSSPMGLLWTFMGYSPAYNIFTGSAEVIGGFLLFFRRTTTLGALVVAAVMSNVVMLNFCYDVPVKLQSSHLLASAVFLLVPDAGRLASVFFMNRPTEPAPMAAPFKSRWMRWARPLAKAVLIVGAVVPWTFEVLGIRREGAEMVAKMPLYGLYNVEAFERGGEAVSPPLTAATRWRTVSVSRYGLFKITMMNDERKSFWVEGDLEKSSLTLRGDDQEPIALTLTLTRPDPEHAVITGRFEDDELMVRLRRVDESKFLLVSRGFRWISEEPFNR